MSTTHQRLAADSIGEWYAQKERDAQKLAEQLAEAEGRDDVPMSEVLKLRRALEAARYVGD